jgi:hypothetical protein
LASEKIVELREPVRNVLIPSAIRNASRPHACRTLSTSTLWMGWKRLLIVPHALSSCMRTSILHVAVNTFLRPPLTCPRDNGTEIFLLRTSKVTREPGRQNDPDHSEM